MTILASPTEPKEAIEALSAIISPLCEERGADYLIYSKYGLAGLQRKEVPHDFMASFTDGRMARETSLLTKCCKFSRVIGEGRFRYWPDGRVVTGRGGSKTKTPELSRFTRNHIRGMIFDIELVKGIYVDWTEDLQDTISYIKSLDKFLAREKHLGLYARPSASGAWYVPTSKDLYLWILQSFQGVGPSIADSIVQHFGGRLPIKWDCAFEELCHVPKLRVKKAQEIWELLGGQAQDVQPKDESLFEDLRKKVRG